METMKASIIKAGTFEGDQPKDWAFDCHGTVPAIDLDTSNGEMVVRWGGYTLEELKAIAHA